MQHKFKISWRVVFLSLRLILKISISIRQLRKNPKWKSPTLNLVILGMKLSKVNNQALLTQVVNQPLIMGILNITPDSFSDGGLYRYASEALVRSLEMI